MWHNIHSPQHTYLSSSYRSNRLGLSHWDPYAVRRSGCLELYYCNMVEWFWSDASLIFDDHRLTSIMQQQDWLLTNLAWKCLLRPFLGGRFAPVVVVCMEDCKYLCIAVMICPTVVNIQTDTQTDSIWPAYANSWARWAKITMRISLITICFLKSRHSKLLLQILEVLKAADTLRYYVFSDFSVLFLGRCSDLSEKNQLLLLVLEQHVQSRRVVELETCICSASATCTTSGWAQTGYCSCICCIIGRNTSRGWLP